MTPPRSPFPWAEHERFVQTCKKEEGRRARHDLRRRAIKKRELLDNFRRRCLENFASEIRITGTTRVQPRSPSRREPRRHHTTEPPKDVGCCQKNGFIWSDLGRTPRNRLSLVVPPIAVKRDRECMERLFLKVEGEEEETRERLRRKHEAITAQCERSLAKVGTPHVKLESNHV